MRELEEAEWMQIEKEEQKKDNRFYFAFIICLALLIFGGLWVMAGYAKASPKIRGTVSVICDTETQVRSYAEIADTGVDPPLVVATLKKNYGATSCGINRFDFYEVANHGMVIIGGIEYEVLEVMVTAVDGHYLRKEKRLYTLIQAPGKTASLPFNCPATVGLTFETL